MPTRRAPILVCGLLVALAACTGFTPGASPIPSAASSASGDASVEASETPEPSVSAAALPQRGEVTIDELPLYATSDGTGTPTATLLRGASVLIVENAPDPAWVWVVGLDGDLTDELAIAFGWAQEEAGEVVQIRRVVVSQSTSGTRLVEEFRAMGPADGLVSFGNGIAPDIVGFLVEGCGSGASPRTGEPDWLNGTFSSVPVAGEVITPVGPVPDDIIFLRAAPGVAASTCAGTAADWYRFSGHFDDPAASTCRTTTSRDGSTIEEVEPAVAVVLCRMRYVITGLEPGG